MATTQILDPSRADIVSNIYFLSKDKKWDTIKPYTARYDPKGAFPHTNIDSVKCDITIKDMRPILNDLKWGKCGFQVVPIQTSMVYEDYNEKMIQEIHLPEIEEALKKFLGAATVKVMDYKIRKRESTFPLATGERYKHRQPSSRAHLDFTHDAVCKIIQSQYKVVADEILEYPWQAINVWHPIRGPLVDWPLAICDASTVDFASDTMASDAVDPWGYIENTQIQHNKSQEWYYLRNQMPHELLVFKNADSCSEGGGVFPGAPHASFYNPNFKSGDFLRESIEIRTLVTYSGEGQLDASD